MPRKKCSLNCLQCELPKCLLDIADQHKYVRENYEKLRHAEYYKSHRDEEISKQKEYDKTHRNAEVNHIYYLAHKAEINKKNKERYANNRDARLQQSKDYYWQHREEISVRRKRRREEKKKLEQHV